ncbi:MAG: DUF4215 domain-containing protein [bacterium]
MKRMGWRDCLGFWLVAGLVLAACGGKGSGVDEVCGNGIVGAEEECDDGNTAAGDGCDGACVVEDGWACVGEPSDCSAVCGDGLLIGEEECDGAELDGETCASLGLVNGTLGCGSECLFDVTGCDVTAECGNGVREYPEDCDATDLAEQTCVSLGFAGGTLACDAGCEHDTSGCAAPVVCGDGQIGAGEDCDGTALGDASCQSLGWDSGALDCAADCSYDTSDCSGGGPVCGNDVQEVTEDCDGSDLGGQDCQDLGFTGGQLECDAQCDFDTGGCSSGPQCGNDTQEGTEQCDGPDLNGQGCVSRGYDGGTLGCTGACTFDEAQCFDCGPGLSACGTLCVDLLNDPAFCGGCTTACGLTQTCIGGQCSQPGLAWVDVGTQPLGWGTAHDLATDGTQPAVAYTQPNAGGTLPVVVIRRYNGVPAWDNLGPNPAAAFMNLNSAVDLDYIGATPYVLFSATDGMSVGNNVHLIRRQGAAWQPAAAPFSSACMAHEQVAVAFDSTTPHITTFGAGGCGLGIDYAYYDGAAWQSHPSTTGFPAQLTMNGNGYPDIVFTDQAYVGLPESSGWPTVSDHTLRSWDSVNSAWANLVGPLDENANVGWRENISLVTDSADNIYAAWSENDSNGVGPSEIFVKRYDATAQTWTLLGGSVDPGGSVHSPNITLIGSTPWIAYVADSPVQTGLVTVRRFDEQSSTWEQIGQTLTDGTPTPPGEEPVIVGIAGIPFVAFRVGDQMTIQHQVYVQHYVPTP